MPLLEREPGSLYYECHGPYAPLGRESRNRRVLPRRQHDPWHLEQLAAGVGRRLPPGALRHPRLRPVDGAGGGIPLDPGPAGG